MEIPENIQQQLNQFQQLQQQAQAVTMQIQNVEVQIQETEVFKQAGTLLIKVEYADALSDTEEKLETLQLRKQTMARQEDRVMKKLEEMQATIQAAMQGMGQ